jgi:porin
MSDFYLQGALTDGVPGDPNSPHGTHIQLNKGDGSLSIVEFGYMPSEKDTVNKTAFGLWNYTAQATDMVTGEPRPDRGFYLLAERTLMAEQGQTGQGLSGFVRYGSVNKDVYPVDWSGSVGLHYQGLFDGRDDDEAGIAVVTSHASSNQQLAGSDSSETAIELTYRAQLLPWMAVQPSLQRIMNPRMDKAVNDATVIGARFEVAL